MVLPGGILIGYHRRMQGSLFGGANPLHDIPKVLSLWHEGKIKLTELITKTYTLDEINEGYADLMEGRTSAAPSSTSTLCPGAAPPPRGGPPFPPRGTHTPPPPPSGARQKVRKSPTCRTPTSTPPAPPA